MLAGGCATDFTEKSDLLRSCKETYGDERGKLKKDTCLFEKTKINC